MGKLTIYSIVAHIPTIKFYFVAAINPVGVVVHLIAVVNMGAVGQVIREIEGNVGFGEANEDVEMGDVNEMGEDNEDIEMGEDNEDVVMESVGEYANAGAHANHL